jgi:two-component system chemotaxis sensor kinase CheA
MWDDLFDPEESAGFFRAEADALLLRIDAEQPNLAHSLESGTTNVAAVDAVLDALRSLQRNAEMLGYGALQHVASRVERLCEIVRDGRVPLAESGVEMLVAGRAFLGELAASSPAAEPVPEGLDEYVDRLERLIAIYSETASIREMHRAPAASPIAPPAPVLSQASQPVTVERSEPDRAPAPTTARTLRIEIERFDELVRCVGDLAAQASRLAALGGDAEACASVLDRVTADMTAALASTRLTTVAQAFDWLSGAVAKMSAAAGKRVNLEASGTDAPFDRAIVVEAGAALMHLLRHCIESDIESPRDRERSRKPAAATLAFNAFVCGNQTVLEVIDDGSGKNALQAGDVSAARHGLARLNGTLTVDTIPGRGLYATARLPLPAALLRCVLVRVAGDVFAVPFDTVVRTHRIAERDETFPLLRVADFLQLARAGAVADAFVVNVDVHGRKAALAVERIEGERQIAVRPLGRLVGPVDGVAGAAVLGDGSIALVLDPLALVTAAQKRRE